MCNICQKSAQGPHVWPFSVVVPHLYVKRYSLGVYQDLFWGAGHSSLRNQYACNCQNIWFRVWCCVSTVVFKGLTNMGTYSKGKKDKTSKHKQRHIKFWDFSSKTESCFHNDFRDVNPWFCRLSLKMGVPFVCLFLGGGKSVRNLFRLRCDGCCCALVLGKEKRRYMFCNYGFNVFVTPSRLTLHVQGLLCVFWLIFSLLLLICKADGSKIILFNCEFVFVVLWALFVAWNMLTFIWTTNRVGCKVHCTTMLQRMLGGGPSQVQSERKTKKWKLGGPNLLTYKANCSLTWSCVFLPSLVLPSSCDHLIIEDNKPWNTTWGGGKKIYKKTHILE